jgi:DNA polymerase I-like protein with 3'-5' exonuclease and polymerase domains
MIDAFNNDKDLHLIAVHHIFGYDYDVCVAAKKKEKKVGLSKLSTDELLIIVLRTAVKRIWYGLNYGIGDEKLALNLTADFRKADKDGRNLQCPNCKTVYPLDYLNTYSKPECIHIGEYPVDDAYVDTKVIRQRKLAYKQSDNRDEEIYALDVILRTVSEKEAAGYRNKLLGVFKKASKWLDNQVKIVNTEKKVQSILGRFRRLNSVDSVNRVDKSRAERQSKNVIQNHAADIVGQVMVLVDNDEELKRKGFQLLGQIHDELLFQTPEDENAPKNLKRCIDIMEKGFGETVMPLKVNLKAEGTLGFSWGDCK